MTNRPNLLIIHTDQQSLWSLSCYGGTVVDTPHVDRLARNGAIFYNFFTNSAVCTPSRGCFVTGRYPTSHGAYTNNIPLNRDEVTFAEILKRNGYRTGYAGKWHLDGSLRPGWIHPERSMGFEECPYMFNRGHWKKIEEFSMNKKDQAVVHPYSVIGDEETYTTDWLTNKTLGFLDADNDRPFCHMLCLPDPHSPVSVRKPYDTMYDPEDMPIPSTFTPESLPDWAMKFQNASSFGLHVPDREDKLRKFLAGYFGEVKLIDDCLGRIIDALEAKGLFENTVIVFSTDHGEYGGEHGLEHKNMIYETAYRIPMVVHWPKGIKAGTQVSNFISTVDFQPTILNLMGVEPCGREEGRDGSAFLRGESPDWDDVSFLHHNSHSIAGIFTPEYELAFVENGDNALFDRINDPDQVSNLFDQPEHASVICNLGKRVLEHHKELGTPSVEWLETMVK